MPYRPRIVKHRIVRSGPPMGAYRVGSREKWLQDDGTRLQLAWLAGEQGKPGLNADILSTTESVRMIADPHFELLGTNAASANSSFTAEGALQIATAGADNDQTIVLPHLDTNRSHWKEATWGTDREVQWEGVLGRPDSLTLTEVWAGLKLTNVPAEGTDANSAFFKFDPEHATYTSTWMVMYSIAGTDTVVDTGVAAGTTTTHHFAINFSSDKVASFFIDGVLVATSGAFGTVDLIPYIGLQALSGAIRTILVRGQAISRLYDAS